MKKIVLTVLISVVFCNYVLAQFGAASSNNVNVNNTYYQNANRKDIISATFRIRFTETDGTPSGCTGTLINRNISDNDLGYYFVTARHCTNNFDANADHYLMFNYQSPTANNNDTPVSNRGTYIEQSESLNDNAYEYIHKTKLRLVDKFRWGDFALLEILTPIPPHFNVTYAGWLPGTTYTGMPSPALPATFVGIHHPRGDIKKISGANQILWLESPIATGCYVITTIIDFLFGWIWGNSASTQVVCNYVDNPWLYSMWTYGVTEKGSSGSGLFINNRLIGVLSGGLDPVGVQFGSFMIPLLPGTDDFYGKLHANYYNASIKNVMNPANDTWIDKAGLDCRKITKYNNLVLPGGNYPQAYYFPANHYQSENKITLRATNDITTNKPITIIEGADYEFIAGNSIELNTDFIVEEGATFTASISNTPQNAPKQETNILQNQMLDKLVNIKLPVLQKDLSENLSARVSNTKLKCYPNPTSDLLFVELTQATVKMEIFTVSGVKIEEREMTGNFEKINVKNYPAGVYLLKVYYTDRGTEIQKFVKNN